MTFFDKYNYKQKKYGVFVFLILLVAASYKRVFSVTLVKRNEISEINTLKEESIYAIESIKVTKARINQLNKLIGKENVTIEKVQQGFLNFFYKKSNGLEVVQIDEVIRYKHPDFSILTHQIEYKGDFKKSLEFIYLLEKEFELGKLINVSFVKRKSIHENEKETLNTNILLQNYEK